MTEEQHWHWLWVMDIPNLDERSKAILAFNKECMSKEAQIESAYEQKAEQNYDARLEEARCA